MKQRYFVVQHPTFGSYKNPIKHRVESSLYYWWWYALTLNEKYLELCSGSYNDADECIKQLFADFGDVRYEGCRYLAFCKWWTGKVETGETRGEFLFAETPSNKFTKQITTQEEFSEHAADSDYFIVAVHKHSLKKHIDKSIERILHRNTDFKKGKSALDILNSTARYKIQKHVTIQSLKKAFDCYTIKKNSDKHISNNDIALLAGISVQAKNNDEVSDKENIARNTSITVSRYNKLAKQIIDNAGNGIFP